MPRRGTAAEHANCRMLARQFLGRAVGSGSSVSDAAQAAFLAISELDFSTVC